VGGAQTISVRSNVERTVCGTQKELINGDSHLTHKGDVAEKVMGDYSRLVEGAVDEKLARYTLQTDSALQLKSGNVIYLEATSGICLKVGGNYIQIDPSGIQIQGTTVLINTPGQCIPPGPPLKTTVPDLPAARCSEKPELEPPPEFDPASTPMPAAGTRAP